MNNTTQHNTTQHNTTQHNTTQHNTTQHNTKLRFLLTLLFAPLAVALVACSDDSDSSDDDTTVTITLTNASLAGKTLTYSDTRGGYENTITFGSDGTTFTYKREYSGSGTSSGTGTGSGTVSTFSFSEDVEFYDEDSTWLISTYTIDAPGANPISLTFTTADSGLTAPDTDDKVEISAGDSWEFYLLCRIKKSGEVTYAQVYSYFYGWYYNYSEGDIVFVWGDATI